MSLLCSSFRRFVRAVVLCTRILPALAGPFVHGACAAAPTAAAETVLWLWDRPQAVSDLPAGAAVAYLHATVKLSGETAAIAYRRWPLRLPADTDAMPVVHIAFDNLVPSPINALQRRTIRAALDHAVRYSHSDWIQLDFEARLSQRSTYLALLRELQPLRTGPVHGSSERNIDAKPGRKLSVTALASWCMNDGWIDPALVDEIVPMYFRMGRDGAAVSSALRRNGVAGVAACRNAAGYLFGEPQPYLAGLRRRYVFHPRSWTKQDARLAMVLPASTEQSTSDGQ
jgi:hypothetical protein